MNPTLKARVSLIFMVGVILALQVWISFLTAMEYRVAMLLVFGVAVVVITFIKFEWTIPVQVFSLFVMGITIGGFASGQIRIYHLVTVFLLAIWVVYVLIFRKQRFFIPNPLVLPILLSFAWVTFTILWAPDLRTSVYRWIKVGLAMGGAIVFINICKNKSHERRVIWYWVFCGVIGGIIIYYSWYAMERGLGDTWLAHQNIVSAMMNVCMFFALCMAILTRRFLLRWFSILTILFTLAVNLNTACRGGLMGLIGGIIVFVILGIFNSKIGRKFPVTMTALFLVGVGAGLYAVSQMESLIIAAAGREFDVLNPMGTDTFVWRLESITTALGVMYEHKAWLWGMGVGAWEFLQETYMEYPWGTFIHNYYMNYFFQYGIIGIALLVWLFVVMIRRTILAYSWFEDYRTRWALNCLMALYACMAVHGTVSIEETNAYVWIMLATISVFLDYLEQQHAQGLPANTKL